MMILISLLGLQQSQAQMPAMQAAPVSSEMNAASMASTYVPIESWVYAAIERLAASGYVQTAFAGLRPWTRMDCARLIDEAREQQADLGADESSLGLLKELEREFAPELRRRDGERNREVGIESVDVRSTSIDGVPLTDGYHSAQTITNDYGRPYGQGENLYAGVSLRATAGRFSAYLRTELQRAATADSPPVSAGASIAAADFTPTAPAGPASGFSRGRIQEAYAAFAFHDNQLTFGKQALWWGPGRGGPLLFSNNAEPVTMLHYDRVRPFELPGLARRLGPIRVQVFAGRLSGQQFVHVASGTIGQPGVALKDQPFLHGQKVSFKPTPNFEFSISRTAIFAGAGAPLTTRSVLRSLFSTGNSDSKTDPGDRRSAVDVQYRLPKLRNWLTAYVDTFTDDEPFPLNYPAESAWSPGLYLSHLPKLAHMDLRAEGYLTPHRDLYPGFYYSNVHYLSGYTNQRQLIGSWIGREANGLQVWSRWWFSPRSSVQASFRHINASSEFLRGGSLQDVSLTADLGLKPEWQMHVVVQDERWRFPLFSATPQHNLTATFQISYRPRARKF
jgi:hypothetical protein